MGDSMDVKSIKKLAEESRFDEALNRCDDLLKTFPERESKILRDKSLCLCLDGETMKKRWQIEKLFWKLAKQL